MQNMIVPLYVGMEHNGNYLKEVELLNSNGISERVYMDKTPDSIHSWMGKVLTVSIKEMFGKQIAGPSREAYLKTQSVSVHPLVASLPFADVNSLLIEVHRKCWENLIRNQESICKYCGTKMSLDIDLDKIELQDKFKEKAEDQYSELVCDLGGFLFTSPRSQETVMYPDCDGQTFNRIIFRVPTLGDAIRNEKFYDDTITFWRKMAMDCIVSAQATSDGSTVTSELPGEALRTLGLKFFDTTLSSRDLKKIRQTLREELPTLPYYYEEECANPRCRRMTPVSMEASGFFSE